MTHKIAFFAPYTEHVGTERAMERIAASCAERGALVDMLRVYREWPDRTIGRVVSVGSRGTTVGIDRLPFPWKKLLLAGTGFVGLVKYLQRERPAVLVTGLLNAVAIAARDVASVDTQVVCSVQGLPQPDCIRNLLWPRLYTRPEAVVVPTESIAERVAKIANIPPESVRVVANPVVDDRLLERGEARPDHPWFADDHPVVVSVGRQTHQKDFETLIRAFATVAEHTDARLIVPGKEGEQSEKLRELIVELGVSDRVEFPGFVDNVAAYMAAADVFVLSSRWEGPGHVLVEALALGTPVVATDCPCGPREILDDGEVGTLVPVGDHMAMAAGVRTLLESPDRRQQYAAGGPESVADFRVERAAAGYRRIIEDLLDPEPDGGDASG
ncbi:glycosyltransferase [Haloarculaceae archaeon H-GB2-1]|nr:glycosyltransferase [Haloarculaceae archaeon H-GB1-1]MEA5388467.1 glycosyltransferase [Haloarculaceae archaeon H-GB11]MEA5406503.1 glycosyltransferase [Haloarculaceae archaeon H-GB2-1]